MSRWTVDEITIKNKTLEVRLRINTRVVGVVRSSFLDSSWNLFFFFSARASHKSSSSFAFVWLWNQCNYVASRCGYSVWVVSEYGETELKMSKFLLLFFFSNQLKIFTHTTLSVFFLLLDYFIDHTTSSLEQAIVSRASTF